MEGYTQADRFIRVETPLGDDVMILEAFSGREAISEIFSYRLDVLSVRADIAPDEIVGKNISFLVRTGDGAERYFNGHVQGIAGGESEGGQLRRYYLDVVPWLWFLTRTTDCRIFQNKTAPDIVEQIFGDLGFSDYRLDLQGTHPEREYCVQYRESDFAFVSRLLEEEGMFYFFTHEQGKHTLVVADHKATHKFCPEKEIQFNRGSLEEDHISHWEHRWEFRTGKWAQTDYDFKKSSTSLMTKTSTLMSVPKVKDYEAYEFPGLYTVKGDGESLTKLRMEMDEAAFDTVSAASTCSTLYAGGKFTLSKHATPQEEGGTWMITGIEHHAHCPAQLTGGARGEESYDNAFTCIPDSTVFRPPLATPKPVVHGLQTAVVTGPAGEEIYPDEFGRVKVQFHWDREGRKDEQTTIWIRVAHHIAGKNWGFHGLPRIGQEVVVAFEEGDPDRPLVIGSVYNDEHMPPYAYPGNKTRSGYQSRSSKGGSPSNFNEFRIEDKKGSEEIYVHAEKDMNRVVENNDTLKVGFDKQDAGDQTIDIFHDRTETVGNDEKIHIKHDRTENVDNNETITIGVDRTEHVKNNEKITIDGNRTEKVVKDETITIDGQRTETVAKDETITINGARTEKVAKDETISISGARKETVTKDETITINGARTEKVAKAESVDIGDSRSHKVGKDDSLNVGKNLNVTAGDSITLKTGSASITMKKDGTITIKGKDITVQGSGKILVKASSTVTIKGSKILQN